MSKLRFEEMKQPFLHVILLSAISFLTMPSYARSKSAHFTGTYTRIKHSPDENQSANLDVRQISRSRIHFHLTALWWPVGNSDSPHNGKIEAAIPLRNHVAVYTAGDYRLILHFRAHTIVLTERGNNPDFGAYVSAAGTYQRTRLTPSAN